MSSIHKAMQRMKRTRNVRPTSAIPLSEVDEASQEENLPAPESIQLDLDLAGLHRQGLLTPHSGHKHLVEEYRRIKRPLVDNITSEAGTSRSTNLIMVTSSLPDEGKTFTAFNLAVSIAMEVEKTVLVVDSDLQRGELSEIMGFGDRPGLADKLRGSTDDLSELLIKTNIPQLTFLPAGVGGGLAPELLASSAMRRLTVEFAERYHDRIIIFDSPPLLVTSESSALAGFMGQIVLVIEAEATPQSAVSDSLAYLAGCEIVGLVLNKTPKRFGSQYYGGYYGPYQQ